ncbi:MAG: N-acetyltransferase [Planctomycetota bacterium]
MIRKAKISDARQIVEIVNEFASEEAMLPRALNDVYEQLRDFFVSERDNSIVGCAALHISWEGLGEIRSLAVRKEDQGEGIGRALVQNCLDEAQELEMNRVFALTYIPDFFRQFGFQQCPKEELPHKIWNDCLKCPKFPNCDEIAVILDLGNGDLKLE